MKELDRELLQISKNPMAKSPKKEPIGDAQKKDESPLWGSEDEKMEEIDI